MTINDLKKKLENKDITLTDNMIEQLNIYAVYLKEYNEKINLTAITEYEEVLDKHFYDSLLWGQLENLRRIDRRRPFFQRNGIFPF